MITLRPADDRGHADHGWLDSWHSFSFGDYLDPKHMHWGPLRVINEDRVEAGKGFGTHGHSDMEIISYVIDGELGHKDSMGTTASIFPGEVQRMSAGTGVTHSEFNVSQAAATHFLQIWIVPSRTGLPPSYEQKTYAAEEKRGQLRLVVSADGHDGSVSINQDAKVFAGLFDAGEEAEYFLAPGRLGYVHLVKGDALVNDESLTAGDALLYKDEDSVHIERGRHAEVLVFDLPQ